jgi:hypothetical protein
MHKVASVLLSLTLFHVSACADPTAIDYSSDGARYHFGAGDGPMCIQGKLDSSPTDSMVPPLYRFMVYAYGRVDDGEVFMMASSAYPTIVVRFPRPLRLEADCMYTFTGEDAGGAEQMFLVGGRSGRLLDKDVSQSPRFWILPNPIPNEIRIGREQDKPISPSN